MSRDSWQAVQAVFLAAIMVISVFAGGIAFSGSAAAEVTEISGLSADNTTAGDTDQVETVTLLGVNKTGSNLSEIEVVISDADVSITDVTVTDSGSFPQVETTVDVDTSFTVSVPDDATPSDDIVVEVTLDTTDAEPGTTGTYTATPNANADASVSDTFQIQPDDDGSQSDDVLTVNPDGTDAYDTIQTAVNNAESGDTVVVSSGTYDEFVNINKSNITIEGPNAGISGDNESRSTESNISFSNSISADNVTINGIRVIPNSDGNINTEIEGANITIKNTVFDIPPNAAPVRLQDGSDNVVITRNLFEGTEGGTDGGNFIVNARQDASQIINGVEITDNTFQDALGNGTTAIQAAGLTNAEINGNTFDNIGEDAIRLAGDVDGTEIRDNEFSNTAQNSGFPAGAIVANEVNSGRSVDISDNQFSVSGDDIFVVAYNRPSSPALDLNAISQDNTFTSAAVTDGNAIVPTTTADVVNVDQQTSYDDLPTAIQEANTGDTIKISSGDYSFANINTDGLTLDGAGMNDTTLSGNQLEIDATDVTLQEVTIDAPGNNIRAEPGSEANGLRIENVRVSDNQQTTIGLDISADGGNETATDRADGLYVENFYVESPSVKGIYLERVNNAVIRNVTVDSVPFTGNENPPSNGIDINVKYDDYRN